MSLEECERTTAERVTEHFKPKKPEKMDKQINLGDLKFFIGMCEANKRKFIPQDLPSDYDHSIIKSYEKKRKSGPSSSNVPQHGAKRNNQ